MLRTSASDEASLCGSHHRRSVTRSQGGSRTTSHLSRIPFAVVELVDAIISAVNVLASFSESVGEEHVQRSCNGRDGDGDIVVSGVVFKRFRELLRERDEVGVVTFFTHYCLSAPSGQGKQ